MSKSIATCFAPSGGDLRVLHAQFGAFAKQIPVLYLILSVNLLATTSTFMRFGHRGLTVFAPAALLAFCLMRGFVWWRRGLRAVAPAEALRMMRFTTWLSGPLVLAFTLWGFAVYGLGDGSAKEQMVFYLALTMIGATFCLTHMRPAAFAVAAFGIVPFCVFFSCVDDGRFRSVALNLTVVAVGVMATILRNARDFVSFVDSQRALEEKHDESLRLNEENFRLANQDPLTGLANRRAFLARLKALSEASAAGGAIAMAFVDLDGFKNVNDDYGHEIGDALIALVARAFLERLPAGAFLARLGGDEFAAVVAAPDAESRMMDFALAITERLSRPIAVGERLVSVGASIGVASSTAGACDGQELLRRADVAMYSVKENGKFGARLYAPELDAERRLQAALGDEIRSGLARGEFEVHYQPIVDARSGAVVAVEALLRWPRRPAGPLGPAKFIPAAEAAGLMGALGMFALRRACEELQGVDLGLAVNISPAQFRDPDFEAHVARALVETGFPASRLTLEVTEGYLVHNPRRAEPAIAALKALGIDVALDDVGAGIASFTFLARYGFGAIKIDRSLTARIAADERARAVVAAIVRLANGFGMSVIAHGVESEPQARWLRLAGCHRLQGYRYAMPKPLPDLLARELRRPDKMPDVA